MINKAALSKILFFDIETCSYYRTYDHLKEDNPRLASLWDKRCEILRKNVQYPMNAEMSVNDLYIEKAGLHPEFGRIICVSVGYIKDGEFKINSYEGDNEVEILDGVKKLFNKIDSLGWYLGGHTIKRFDIPYLGKRFAINRINPPENLHIYNKKPWETKIYDLPEIWSFGAWQEGFTGLDLMSCVLDVKSPKGEMHGSKVQDTYYNYPGGIEKIKEYCEEDVRATMDVFSKLNFEENAENVHARGSTSNM